MHISQSGNVLDAIVAHKREEIAARKQAKPLGSFISEVRATESHSLEKAIQQSKTATPCILEVKPASPSAGVLTEKLDLEPLLKLYAQYGVAISVLTDEKYFGGNLELLRTISEQVALPTLCKDFIIDPYQVYEARQAGAKAVLIIVKSLTDPQLAELNQLVLRLGMTPFIEVQDEAEIERALVVQPSILLINNRNLQTLEIDLKTTERLSPKIPKGILRISASGVQNREDLLRLRAHCDGFLIGSALMREPSPEALERKLQELLR